MSTNIVAAMCTGSPVVLDGTDAALALRAVDSFYQGCRDGTDDELVASVEALIRKLGGEP